MWSAFWNCTCRREEVVRTRGGTVCGFSFRELWWSQESWRRKSIWARNVLAPISLDLPPLNCKCTTLASAVTSFTFFLIQPHEMGKGVPIFLIKWGVYLAVSKRKLNFYMTNNGLFSLHKKASRGRWVLELVSQLQYLSMVFLAWFSSCERLMVTRWLLCLQALRPLFRRMKGQKGLN